jgi:Tfp pilus assembly protein PilF
MRQARKDCHKVIELDPEYPAAYDVRGLAYDDLDDSEKARKESDRAVELIRFVG